MAKKPKAKKMTLEALAATIQQDFCAIRDEVTAASFK
jgi:hypothetical protein